MLEKIDTKGLNSARLKTENWMNRSLNFFINGISKSFKYIKFLIIKNFT